VTVTFSEALDPATVSSSTFELRNAANVLVPATVSWNSATLTATLVPSAPLAGLSTHTVTLRGGAVDPRVKDPAGNALAANAVWSFTTGVPNVLPSVTLTSPVAGARFTAPAAVSLAASAADTDGTITKVEFYRGTTLVGEGTAAPYRATDTGVAVGTYSYTARAYDSNGGVATSAAVTVTVSPPPTPVIYLYDELGRLIGVEH
jgi:hypothetical protein